MLVKRFMIMVIDPTLKAHLVADKDVTCWLITANSMQSAWRKFSMQQFGALKPNAADYDISLHSVVEVIR